MVGLYVQPVDGGKLVDISNNVKCPSYLGYASPQMSSNGDSITSHGIFNGGQLFVIPRRTCLIYTIDGAANPHVVACSGVSISGGDVYCSYSMFNQFWDKNRVAMEYDVFQVINSQPQGFGLFLQNSANFFAISNQNVIGQCIKRVSVTFAGSYALGVGSDTVVFAHWHHPDASIYLDRSSMTIYAYNNNGEAVYTVTMDIVVFSNQAPTPHNGGLTLWREDGVCVFSSRLPPLVWRGGYVDINGYPGAFVASNVPAEKPMVPLCSMGVHSSGPVMNGSYGMMFYAGFKMVNNQVTAWRARQYGAWYEGALSLTEPYYQITPMSLPVIDAADYL
ncbi:DUF6453 family protein [Dickeya fangzhongdai]|uniref:DUF6453 family protein n=1 Tax=Dickeya fangzhongdai TaxID=1778540 RepID=UPI00136EF068|nr:DUF6453 family protein [Dickeya fangzhongdai]UMB78885.1 DUF6453 family protein [Dickeya fangzhongdai]